MFKWIAKKVKEMFAQPEPTIKGNINSRGQKVYHVPSGKLYDITDAEVMFHTEEDAKAAGYKKSRI